MKTGMSQYVVYDHPKDYPDAYVCRRWDIIPGRIEPDNSFLMVSKEIETIRHFLQFDMQLVCIPRSKEDDPVIVETWI